MTKGIVGIQQIGIGIPNVHQAWDWYRKYFALDVPIFEEAAEANLMLPYTAGIAHMRHAILAISMQGGGGFEIWQYTSRTPQPSENEFQLGDLGIQFPQLKCRDIIAMHQSMTQQGADVLGGLKTNPLGKQCFYVRDPYGNIFQIIECDNWFSNTGALAGGVCGAVIGVSDMEKSLTLYRDILGYDEVAYDKIDSFSDLSDLPGGQETFRRVILKHKEVRMGAFSELLGTTEIELLQCMSRRPAKIFENRLWGDLGFIHLCFDINGMSSLKEECEANGFPFTVDSSNSFDMGEAAGHFTYIEDPDGTLIEFVETHKIPILKKIGWYLNLRNKNTGKPLPKWILKTLGLNRKKG